MLLSLVLIVTPERKMSLPNWLGKAVHAMFLGWINRLDSLLAEHLHSDQGIKPFTVSSLIAIDQPNKIPTLLNPREEYYLRFTTFEGTLSNILTELIYHCLPSEVLLENCSLKVVKTITQSEQHPWAGTSSYQDLINTHLLNATPPKPKIDLAFIAPTAFRSQDKNIPLPLPGLVFGNLLEKWNAFAPVALNPELKRYSEECLALSQYNLHTSMLNIAGGKQVGFVGRCQFITINRDPYWLKQINLLADFAFYTGTGAKTTMGMGQTRRISTT